MHLIIERKKKRSHRRLTLLMSVCVTEFLFFLFFKYNVIEHLVSESTLESKRKREGTMGMFGDFYGVYYYYYFIVYEFTCRVLQSANLFSFFIV